MLSSAWLGHRLDRLSQQLPCSGSPDVSGENKEQLGVPVERLGELYERLGNGPLDLARLDPADLRSREAAPPRQPPHRKARMQTRLSRHLGHRLHLILHHDHKSSCFCTFGQRSVFASDAISYRYSKKRDREVPLRVLSSNPLPTGILHPGVDD